MSVRVLPGDCLEILPTLEAESVDSCVCDPPYHLTSIVKRFGSADAVPAKVGKTGAYARASAGFMGKVWDGGDIAFRPATWGEVLRVMKPGAYMVCFASTRGYHRMVCAIEDAGFIIHPMLGWLFATGFPKAHRVHADGWEGWRYGLQSLKPALEPVCLAQKPMSEKTGTTNVLRHGTGALNIEGCRVAMGGEYDPAKVQRQSSSRVTWKEGEASGLRSDHEQPTYSPSGRWPPNLAHDGSPEVLEAFARFAGGRREGWYSGETRRGIGYGSGAKSEADGGKKSSGTGDVGTAARFFPAFGFDGDELRFMYSAKADAADRAGSKHPTCKPVALMRWLVRLVTPPGGVCLDCFAGSGTTGEACLREGFSAVLIEREEEYLADIARRLARMKGEDTPLFSGSAA